MTMRSYALQHMRPWYWEENMRDPAVKQAFYDGLEQSGNELSGVALLALAYLSEELPDEFDRVFNAERAAVLAGSPEVSALTRVSALDVSSRNGNASALEVARGILAAEEESLMLRAAACGAIGRQGTLRISNFWPVPAGRTRESGPRPMRRQRKSPTVPGWFGRNRNN